MIAISSLVLIATLAYIGYYEKNKTKKRIRFPKKSVTTILLTSVFMLIGSATVSENNFSEQLAAVEAKNEKLLAELSAEQKLNQQLGEQVVALEEKQQQVSDEKTKTKEKIASLEKKVATLTEENTALQEKNDKLVEAKNEQPAKVATSTSTSTKTEAASGGSEYFQNCTHLRGTYPGGVGQDHPAYQSKMDRDKDGWACE